MAQIIWTEPALQELDEIADYISLDNPNAARKLIRSVFKRVAQLREHPKSGKPVEDLEGSIYRRLLVSPCQIFYREENNRVYIIYIIRDEQFLHLDILRMR
jgi:toxin ParE1/3/4